MDGSRSSCRFMKGQKTRLMKVALVASLVGLVGCEGILGGIQDPGSGSGCSFVVNILPVCGGAAIDGKQVKPEDLLKQEPVPRLAWLEALLRKVAEQV